MLFRPLTIQERVAQQIELSQRYTCNIAPPVTHEPIPWYTPSVIGRGAHEVLPPGYFMGSTGFARKLDY